SIPGNAESSPLPRIVLTPTVIGVTLAAPSTAGRAPPSAPDSPGDVSAPAFPAANTHSGSATPPRPAPARARPDAPATPGETTIGRATRATDAGAAAR